MNHKMFDCYLHETVNEPWAYAYSVFSPEECNKIINLVLDSPEKYSLYDGHIMSNDGKSQLLNNEIRRSKITLLPVNDENCNWIFGRVVAAVNQLNAQYFNFKVDRIECLQFSEYTDNDGGFYVKHRDEFYKSGMNRKLSFSVQLSDPETYEGGDLLLHINTNPDYAKKEHGSVTIFPSYSVHEVTPVTKGTRYSLVGWVLGPKFV